MASSSLQDAQPSTLSSQSPSQPPSASPQSIARDIPSSPVACDDSEAPDASFISTVEAQSSFIPLSELQQLQTASSTDHNSLFSAPDSQRPSLSASSRRISSFRSSTTFTKLFNGRNKKHQENPAPSPRRESAFEKLSFSDRLTWVLTQTVSPAKPQHVVIQKAAPQRILVQRAVSDSSENVDQACSENTQATFTEKTLTWSDSDPTDPTLLQLVTAPGQDKVTSPLKVESDAYELHQASASHFDDTFENDQESEYDGDNDEEEDIKDDVEANSSLPSTARALGRRSRLTNVAHEEGNTDKMDFARSLTRRLKRSDRSERGESRTQRPRISLPVNLISSTNMSYLNSTQVERIHSTEETSTNSASGDETSPASVRSSTDKSLGSAEPSLTDASSVTSLSPVERNHLTQYFQKSPKRYSHSAVTSVAAKTLPREPRIMSEDFESSKALRDYALPSGPPPAIPRRAASHSKREHVRLARARSIRASSASFTSSLQNGEYTFSRESETLTPPESNQTNVNYFQHHPFSNELEQLSEVAEEFGRGGHQSDSAEDGHIMLERGLARLGIDDYMTDVANPWMSQA